MFTDKKQVILRADGNSQIGLGHVYRLLALAEILKEKFACTFVIDKAEKFILNEIKKYCVNCIELDNKLLYKTPDTIKDGDEVAFDLKNYLTGNEIVVTDGYWFGQNYQRLIKSAGSRLVSIDDLAATKFYADIVINHAPGIDTSKYKMAEYTKLLTGLDYAIIRNPFFKPFLEKKIGRRVFISLGGADYFGYTERLICWLNEIDYFEEIHVLCSSFFNKKLIENLNNLQEKSKNIHLYFDLDANQLVDILDNCTEAFTSASTVLIESYSRGLNCFMGYYTLNQKFIYDGFTKNNLAIGVGLFENLNKEKILSALVNKNLMNSLTEPFTSKERLLNLFSSL